MVPLLDHASGAGGDTSSNAGAVSSSSRSSTSTEDLSSSVLLALKPCSRADTVCGPLDATPSDVRAYARTSTAAMRPSSSGAPRAIVMPDPSTTVTSAEGSSVVFAHTTRAETYHHAS